MNSTIGSTMLKTDMVHMKTQCGNIISTRMEACIFARIEMDMFIKQLICVYYIPDTLLVTGQHDLRKFNKCFIDERMIYISNVPKEFFTLTKANPLTRGSCAP